MLPVILVDRSLDCCSVRGDGHGVAVLGSQVLEGEVRAPGPDVGAEAAEVAAIVPRQ